MSLSPSCEYYLGCDISLTSPGFAVIAVRDRKPSLSGTYNIKTTSKQSYASRFVRIEEMLALWLQYHIPFTKIIREKFASPNPDTCYTVFGAWGSVDRALWSVEQQTVHDAIAQSRVKKILTGSGKADKHQVEVRVREILRLPPDYQFKTNDESDAAAVVLAFLMQEGLIDV